jgi:GH25 family lysozyme M1 (1,4-beta-N-acetylmuramidase)
MAIVTVTCDYCGTVHEVAPGFETLNCLQCGAAMKANFAYYPLGVTRTASAISDAQSTRMHGVDLSYWQGAVDFAKLASKVNFAYIRAGYGNESADPRMREYMQGCRDNGIPFGLYWYLKPGKDWKKHADNFARYTSKFASLPPVMDVEETGGMNKASLAGWLEKFVLRYEATSGRQLAIYTSPGFWNSNMPKTNWAKNHKLWVAHWTSAAAPTLPADWVDINQPKTWTFWQYGVPAIGKEYGVSSSKIDVDWYNGDAATFEREFGVAPHIPDSEPPLPPPPEPPVIELPEYVRTTAFALNLRHSPAVLADNKSGYATLGTRLKVEGEQGGWYKITAWVSKDYCKPE